MRPITDEAIREIVMAIVEEFHPSAVYLFGSRGRDEATAASDIDLLVVVPEQFSAVHSRRQELARLWQLVARFRLPVDVLLYSEQECEAWRAAPGHVIARALHEGKALYAA